MYYMFKTVVAVLIVKLTTLNISFLNVCHCICIYACAYTFFKPSIACEHHTRIFAFATV